MLVQDVVTHLQDHTVTTSRRPQQKLPKRDNNPPRHFRVYFNVFPNSSLPLRILIIVSLLLSFPLHIFLSLGVRGGAVG